MKKKSFLLTLFCGLCIFANAAVFTYPGIHYAHAERFQAPVVAPLTLPSAVSERKVAYQRAFHVSQPTTESHYVLPQHALYRMTEDCQVLTVNTPVEYNPLLSGENLPVLVYIHGGNYFAGGGEKPNTQLAELAEKEHVVTVTVTYRLGIFGYYYEPGKATPNCGLLDQLAALEWVKKNIALFGGDPDNITLAGQSAGAQSVVYCLADTNRVAIRRAVVFSPPMGLTTSACTAEKRTKWVNRYFETHYGDLPTPLTPYNCPADTLLAVQLRYQEAHPQNWHSLPFSPTDLPQKPRYGKRVQWPEQVVVCAQKHDGSMFGPKVLWPLLTSVVFTCPEKAYVRYLERQGVDVRYHLFTWEPSGSPLKAAHCCELPLLLGTTDEWLGTWIMGDVTADELNWRRAKAMSEFAHFMRTGEWTME